MSEASVCLNHPNTPATHRCAVCRKPLCDTCAILDHGAAYCSQQCRADAIRTSAMVNQALDAKRRTSRRACIRSLVVLIILAALAAAAPAPLVCRSSRFPRIHRVFRDFGQVSFYCATV